MKTLVIPLALIATLFSSNAFAISAGSSSSASSTSVSSGSSSSSNSSSLSSSEPVNFTLKCSKPKFVVKLLIAKSKQLYSSILSKPRIRVKITGVLAPLTLDLSHRDFLRLASDQKLLPGTGVDSLCHGSYDVKVTASGRQGTERKTIISEFKLTL